MKRVLQVLGSTDLGGAESRIMDLYRHMNRDEIQFDFLVHHKGGYFEDEIKKMGGNIYYLPSFRIYNIMAYRKACHEFFNTHNGYLAVHGHMTSTASIYLPIAKKHGIPLTIAHARSAGVDPGLKGFLTKLLRKNLWKKCDLALSCSDLAGKAVFGNHDFQFMPNAIDTKDFLPDEEIRAEIRKKYHLENSYVVGHVGRFHYAKNHEFLIDIFSELTRKKPEWEVKLLLLGEGELMEKIKEKVKLMKLDQSVIFAGNHRPVSPFYQAMDIFLFPSKFEGMPGTVVEAQAAGLYSFISDSITEQVKATELVSFISLNKTAEEWAEKIIAYREKNYKSKVVDLSDTYYDVNKQVEFYRKLYLQQIL